MNRDDTSLAFICGCLSYCLQHEGTLTQRQARAAQKVFERVLARWWGGQLDCQVGDVVTVTQDASA
jgi:hypothetical protein